jgi:hypothetical protein
VKTLLAAAGASLVLLLGCSQPPMKEISAAGDLLARARAGGAGRWAPDRLAEAEAAMTLAHQKVEQKDYRGALSAALDAAEKARQAASATTAAMTAAHHAAEKALVEARTALADAQEIHRRAAAAGVPERVFNEPARAGEDVRRRAEGVAAALAKDELPEAQRQATELTKRAAELPGRYRAAQARWQWARAWPRPTPRPGGRR